MSSQPIADHAMLSDCHTAALVDLTGSIEWLCFPRFDSPSVFGRLLDDRAGSWSIRPRGVTSVSRRYVDRTMVLETTFQADGGTMRLTDALAVGPDNHGHALGRGAPHLLLRRAVAVEGEVEVEMEYSPRPEYGLIHPILFPVDGGLAGQGGAARLRLSTPVTGRVDDSSVSARFSLRAGQAMGFALHHRSSWEELPRTWSQEEIAVQLAATEAAWRSWSELHQHYQGPWHDLVHHSGRVLQGLTFQPTGAIVAAATTSLPESPGGERNWDYRYTWVRDASLTIDALWVAACPDEAGDFFSFMARAAAGQVRRDGELQTMFGIGGEHDLHERQLGHLSGWRDSRPVRIGNAAWEQRQLDVYGELLNAAYRLPDELAAIDQPTRELFTDLADAAARRWVEPDHGIWEVRGEPRHFLHSKLMCWVALDRAVRLADVLHASDRADHWRSTMDSIRAAIDERGWSARLNAYSQAFDSDDLDASALMMVNFGFAPGDDPRMLATLEAIETRLTDSRGLVYRYLGDDGLAGREGTFLACTFWLAQAWALAGRTEHARQVFERASAYCNDVGLLAEEVDPETGQLLGNFPQAFSHIGLINAAWAISEAETSGA
ncbi:MAG: glycoside hydrolase family 15 protein [Candidatus Dormibacteria bacterium]